MWKFEGLFTLFCTFLHSEKLVVSTFMGHILTRIDVIYAYISLNLLYDLCYSLSCWVQYVYLPLFYPTELPYRTVTPSAQVEFERTYSHIKLHSLHLYMFEVVLAIFVKGC